MKKIIITLAAFAALSTAAFANDGGNDNSTFGEGFTNGTPAPQDVDPTLVGKRRQHVMSMQYFGTASNRYQNDYGYRGDYVYLNDYGRRSDYGYLN